MYCTEKDCKHVAEKFLEKYENVSKINIDRETTLILASRNEYLGVIKLLLKKDETIIFCRII